METRNNSRFVRTVHGISLSKKILFITLYITFNFQDSWISIIHHICGEHEWKSGQCPHEPIEGEDNNPYLTKDSKAAEAIRKIVFDVKWLKSLEKYRFFR